MRILNEIAINNQSAATTQTSGNIDISSHVAVSCIGVLTGSPVGVLKLQVSNDLNNPQTFIDLAGSTVSVNAAGTYLIPCVSTSYQFMRVVYAATSGTGTVTATVKGNGY